VKGLRPAGIIAAAALLLVAGALAGLYLAARVAPERLAELAEEWLGSRLGPVEIGEVGFAFHWGPAVEARGLRLLPEGEGDPSIVGALEAARVRLTLDLTDLFQRRPRIGRVQVIGLRAQLVRTAEGELRPKPLARLLAQLRGGPEERKDDEKLRGRLAVLRDRSLGLPLLEVEDATVVLHELDAKGRPAGDPLSIEGLQLDAGAARITGGFGLRAAGSLLEAEKERGSFELQLRIPILGDPHGEAALAGWELSFLRRQLARTGASLPSRLEGRANARVEWRVEDETQEGELELLVLDLRGSERGSKPIYLPTARAQLQVGVGPTSIEGRDLELSFGALRFAGSARIGRPWRDGSPVGFDLRAEPTDVDALRPLVDAFGGEATRRLAGDLVAGRIERFEVSAERVTRADWRAFSKDPLAGWPQDLAVELGVSGVELRAGEGDPIRKLRAQASLARDRIALHDASALLGELPLPGLDIELSGVQAVAAALAEDTPIPAVPALPGLLALDEWQDTKRTPGSPPSWERAEIEASRLDHPVLLCPISDLHAVVRPVPDGLDAEILEARWGSARIAGRVRRVGQPAPGRLSITARAEPGGEAPLRDSDPGAWLLGRFQVTTSKLGKLSAREVVGTARFEGDRVAIRDGDAKLVPRGRLVGQVDVRLDQRDALPYVARLRIEDGSVPDLIADFDGDPEVMTGTAVLSGDLEGHLRANEKELASLRGPITMKLRDGEIRKRMNLLFAIAAASDTFNPFRSRDVLPYEALEGELAFDHGTVRADSLSLTGPAVRLVATGSVNLLEADYPVEAVVGLFFFKTLDTVIGKVPIVNRILLGKDENLMAAYFALNGPWVNPQARVLPQTLLTSGPLGIVTDGLPGFVRSGLSTLQRLVGGGGPPEENARAEAGRDRNARP
jgi:hypothetical protein